MRAGLIGAGLLAMFSLAQPALAWYDFGHEVVAAIAYKRLQPKIRERVDALLQLNPYYKTWSQAIPSGIPDAQRNMYFFMQAATWPDAIKKDPQYVSDGEEGGNRPDSADAGQNIGYTDKRMHKYWHYVDRPFSCDRSKLAELVEPNASTQIELFRKTLGSDASDDLKSYDLVWLLHLVGDVHQPLHCVTRVNALSPQGDKGGNDVKLDTGCGVNRSLHSLWDGAVGDALDLGLAAQYAQRFDGTRAKRGNDVRVKDWLAESVKLAKTQVYKDPVKCGNGPFVVTAKYEQSAKEIAQKRVELAGERLANLLNRELK